MKVAIALLAGFIVGTLSGLIFGYSHWRNPDLVEYPEVRAHFLENLIRQTGPVDTLVLGDSIVESTDLSDVCGKTFNAGVGSSMADTASHLAMIALPLLKPKTVVVNVGRNSISRGYSLKQMEAGYLRLVHQLRGYRLILVGIPESPAGTAFIKRTAAQIGAAFVEPVPPDLTFEGIHPTPQGAKLLRLRIAAACR